MERAVSKAEYDVPDQVSAHSGAQSGEIRPLPDRESAPVPESRWGWLECTVLAGYAAVVAVGIHWHEAWADEAQAWMLGRDNSWWNLMMHRIRYEGSPGLWHTLMWLMARLHLGYTGMHWATGLIAVAGIAAFLRWSPFPLVLRILLPFGFWLAYQNAVVARSYCVFALLAFPAAALLRRAAYDRFTPRRLAALAILLGLMSNLSVHSLISSFGLTIVTLVLLRRQTRAGDQVKRTVPALILCTFWTFAVVTTFPPSDVNFPAGKNLQISAQKIWATLGSKTAKAELAELKEEKQDGTAPLPGELPLERSHVFQRTPGEAHWRKFARILSLITFPVSNFRLLALAACILVIAQAIVFKPAPGQLGWIGLIPWALMVLLFTQMYMAPRHAGMIWETLLLSLWLTWPAEPTSNGHAVVLRRLTLAALVLVAAVQAEWTIHSVRGEVEQPYAGDEAMANWLRANAAGKRIAGFSYHSIGVAGWFDHPLYFNQPASYWLWTQRTRIDPRAPFTIATHPDVIVVGGWYWSPHNADITEDWITPDPAELNRIALNDSYGIIPYAEAHGYRETHRFCGHAFMRYGYSEQLCQVALQPDPVAQGQ